MKTDDENKKGLSPLAAAAVGGIMGAVGATAVIALSDKTTRKKVKEKIMEMKEKGQKHFEEMRKRARETKDKESVNPKEQTKEK